MLILVWGLTESLSAQSNWKGEWEKTLKATEVEGHLTLYGCCYEYDRILEGFKKKHPKIKVTTVLGTGNQLSARILAERRGDKYLPDVFSAGANTIHDVLYKARALDLFRPALILPEVLDLSKWYDGEHRYIDPEKRYIFAFVANSQSGQVSYNVQQVAPGEFKSYWDFVNSKWKGKMVSLDPTSFGMGATLQFFYFHPDLGPAFIRKLYGENANGGEPGRASDDGLASFGQVFNLHPLHGRWRGGERNAARAAHRLSRYGRLERREQLKRCRRHFRVT